MSHEIEKLERRLSAARKKLTELETAFTFWLRAPTHEEDKEDRAHMLDAWIIDLGDLRGHIEVVRRQLFQATRKAG